MHSSIMLWDLWILSCWLAVVTKLIVSLGLFSIALFAQEKGRGGEQHGGGHPDVGGGHIPAHGPEPHAQAPQPQAIQRSAPQQTNHFQADRQGHPEAPHVHAGERSMGGTR